jgi:hypothetical protein
MSKYIMVYKNKDGNALSTIPKEEVTRMMELWGEWIGSMGNAVVDRGTAFKSLGKTITSQGVKDTDSKDMNMLTGYTIIDAKDFDEALGYAKGNPAVMGGGGMIEIYEAFGM